MEELAGGRDEQAAEWCLRIAESRLSAGERGKFDAWLADSENRAAFEQAIAVWLNIETAADQPELIHIRSAALESLRRANSRRWARRVPDSLRGWSAAAAVFIVALAAALLINRAPQIYETGIGERRVARLEDGSQLSLDAATRVEVRLRNDRRELRLLSGRAKFDVAKDPLRPFTVSAESKIVVATGTSFSVELLPRQMRVVLYEGRVEVLDRRAESRKDHDELQTQSRRIEPRSAANERALTPGREMVVAFDRTAPVIATTDPSRSLSWEAGQLNFVNEPLELAVERMNRYSTAQLAIGDPAAAALKINGVFTAGDIDAFVEGVTALLPVAVVREPRVLILKSAAAGKK